VESLDCRTQFWKRIIQGLYKQIVVSIDPVVSEKFLNFNPLVVPFSKFCLAVPSSDRDGRCCKKITIPCTLSSMQGFTCLSNFDLVKRGHNVKKPMTCNTITCVNINDYLDLLRHHLILFMCLSVLSSMLWCLLRFQQQQQQNKNKLTIPCTLSRMQGFTCLSWKANILYMINIFPYFI
jgi:hypothetical protein